MSDFFKAFNSLQIVSLFAGFPFGLSWLHNAEFSGHQAAFWTATVVYGIFALLMTGAVWHALDD